MNAFCWRHCHVRYPNAKWGGIRRTDVAYSHVSSCKLSQRLTRLRDEASLASCLKAWKRQVARLRPPAMQFGRRRIYGGQHGETGIGRDGLSRPPSGIRRRLPDLVFRIIPDGLKDFSCIHT